MPHEWLTAYGGIALVVLGSGYLLYALLRRDKTVQVYKRQDPTGAASEPREAPQKPSEQQEKGAGHPEDRDAEKPSWWRRVFLGE